MYLTNFSERGDSKREVAAKIETLNNKIKTARELLLKGDLDPIDYKTIKI
ncbi:MULTISPECIES: hypothetical protein [unclassified Pedobacter]|nr:MULTISPECIES: hypothetical protein [unclassified Pedobacter]NII83494.1 hypothetical protein [Pedobacter sp. SG908]NMN37358.1 hypothetical protein [Pedobacter sp. SG918]